MFEELPGPIDNMLQEVKNPCTQAMVTATYQLSFTQLNPTQSKWIQPKLYPIHSCPWPHRDASSISSCWGAMTPSSKACACRMKNNRTKQRGMNPSKKIFGGWYLKRWSKSWGNFWFSTKTHPCSYNPCLTKLPFKGFEVVFRILSPASTKESSSMLGFVVGTGAIDATTCSSSAHISITCLSLFPRFDSVCNLCGGRRSHYFWLKRWKKGVSANKQPHSLPTSLQYLELHGSTRGQAVRQLPFGGRAVEGVFQEAPERLWSVGNLFDRNRNPHLNQRILWHGLQIAQGKNTNEIPSAHGFRSFRAKSPTLNQTRSTPKPNGGFGPACVLVTLLGLAEPITPNACARVNESGN